MKQRLGRFFLKLALHFIGFGKAQLAAGKAKSREVVCNITGKDGSTVEISIRRVVL